MGQTSTGVTWPVWTRAVPGMTVVMSPVSARNVTDIYWPGYGLHTICVM